MLGGMRLKVSLSYEKTCFAYINPKFSSNNKQTQCVQVLCKDKQLILWVVFSNNVLEGQIACNPIYAKLIGLQEGFEVFVSPYGDVKVLDELHVDADSPDDQDILEHNAELLQLRVLDQLRLVVANQKAVVWISTSLPIIFTPKQTGILVNHSKIIVKVDAFNSMQGLKSPHSETIEDIDSKFKNIGNLHYGMLRTYLNVPQKIVFRTICLNSDGRMNMNHPYTVFVNECFLEDFKEQNVLATIKNIPFTFRDNDESDTENNSHSLLNDILVEVVPITSVIYRSVSREIPCRNIPTILVPKTLNNLVDIQNGSKIVLTIIGENIEVPDHIEIVMHTEKLLQTEFEVIEKFKQCVIKDTNSGKNFLINDSIIHQNMDISEGYLQFKLKPEKLKYSLLNSDAFRHCTVSVKCLNETDFVLPKPFVSNFEYDYKNYCRTVKSIESLVDKVLLHLYFEIYRDANFKHASEIKSNVLVTGGSGTGKTALCHTIQQKLTVWSHILHCRSLKGRKDIPEVLGKAILMCQERSPAVLICDDIDALVPPNMEGASPQDIAYYQRLAVVIKHQLQSCSGVVVLMTSQSMKELHPTLKQFSGKPLFTAQFGIAELDQMERVELFEHLLNSSIREEFLVDDDDVIKMAMETTGCSVREVIDYFHRKIFKAVKKNSPASPKLRLVDDIATDSDRVDAFDIWGPVGGLDDVKRSLIESIFWPIMYPALFPSQSCGILLYGPPGTGKSHIGSCLARLTNMNLIAVKGPELLSKYIGQSEKAVRDIFDKADMKRPCILFFDEFDSLAPKRGHDSTGVTDRVVNQLLTRLDGAEGGARGPVVAATSRPDLIDPALLRPGRLQTHLYCGLPDQRGRYEVLRTLSKSVTINEEVDLEELSVRTDGYSPADLKSLLVTAQLTRLEKQLEGHSEEKTMESVVVHQDDIESALLETKPSLSREQKLFYDMIYRRFRGEPLTPEQGLVSSRTMEKQRVTLA